MNEKNLLQTAGRAREQAPASKKSGGFLSIHEVHDGQFKLTAKDYCNRFAKDAEFEQLKKIVEARRKKIPAYSWWICKKCGFVSPCGGEQREPLVCVMCNLAALVDGGWMRKMDEGEIAAYQKSEGERNARIAEREEAAELFQANQNRGKVGLPIFTLEEFKAARKTDWERKQEWEKQETERRAAWEKKKEAMAHKGEIQPKVKA